MVQDYGHASTISRNNRNRGLQSTRSTSARLDDGRRRACGVGRSLSGLVPQSAECRPISSASSSGAALGAVLGIYFSLGVFGIQALAFAGGLAAVAAVYLIGTLLRHHDPILTLVLAGVVIGTLLGSVVGLIKYLADPYNQLPAITFWLLGSLTGITAA